jgi:PAS domain S-box-containing protein
MSRDIERPFWHRKVSHPHSSCLSILRPSITLPEAPARQRELIDAALAVNDAPTPTEAFQILRDRGRSLVGADRVEVAVCEEQVGAEAAVERTQEGTVIRVPLSRRSCNHTLDATWERDLDAEEAEHAGDLLEALTRLTSVEERSLGERPQQAVLNEQHLYALFDSMPIPLIVGDAKTHSLLAANRAFLDLTGFASDEILGTTPPFPWWESHEDTTDGFEEGTVANRIFRRKDGRPLPAEVMSHSIPGDHGETALLLGVITDRSEKRRLDQQLVQSGKLAAIGELAAGVAHEINNPLFAILGLTEFLLKESEAGSKARQRLELIQQTGLEIKEIVRALLDFARENAEERHVIPLEDVIRSTVDLVRRTNAHKGVELVDSYDGSAALVTASPNQLKQIFLNLMANARQAMPNGGTVHVGVHREGEFAVATVSDDGPGIQPDVIERIFEPFFTTKRLTGGTGLGLSVSLGIAEAHGGTLTAASEPGRGSSFTLRLPVTPETV